MTDDLTVEESRLIAVRRAISKFGNPQIINVMDASVLCAYITNLIDLDEVEKIADSTQVEYFLDGLVLGMATSRLLEAQVDVDDLPKSKEEKAKQFQTGVDPKGEVRINN